LESKTHEEALLNSTSVFNTPLLTVVRSVAVLLVYHSPVPVWPPVASPHDRHRHRPPPDDRLGDAPARCPPTVAPNDDVVEDLLVGVLDDGPGGRPTS
jgi:hypothetical protein